MRTKKDIQLTLVGLWNTSATGKDAMLRRWLDYENLIDIIYHSELSQEDKLCASMEALDACTRRGHFDPKNYLN